MNLDNLNIFIQLHNLKSINKAAASCYTSPQNISKILNKLEMEVGTSLFVRTNTGLTLTQAGEFFLDFAKKVVLEYHHTQNEIKSLSLPHLKNNFTIYISAAGQQYMLPLLNKFLDDFPNTNLFLYESSPLEIIETVFYDENTIGIIPYFEDATFNKIYEPFIKNLSIVPLFRDEFNCIVPENIRNNIQINDEKISLEDFFDYSNVMLPATHPLLYFANNFEKKETTSRKIYLNNSLYGNYYSGFQNKIYIATESSMKNHHILFENQCCILYFKENTKFSLSVICTHSNLNNPLTQALIMYASAEY